MIDLGLVFLIVWVLKNAAVDVSCAIQGTENPRYALKRQKALAAGKAAPSQPRYGSRDWLGDLVSDGLAAQTAWRRARAAKKAEAAKKDERPLDDLAEAVREEPRRPVAPATVASVDTEEFPEFRAGEPRSDFWHSSVVHHDDMDYVIGPHQSDPEYKGGPYPVPLEVLATARAALAERDPYGHRGLKVMDDVWDAVEKAHPGVDATVIDQAVRAADRTTTPQPDPCMAARTNEPKDTRPDAVIIQFPNLKEINMSSEITGVPTAVAFAEAAASAHESFALAGSEGYIGALGRMGMGGEYVATAQEAQEASTVAAAKWAAHAEKLKEQHAGREFYQSNPDAADKQALVNE